MKTLTQLRHRRKQIDITEEKADPRDRLSLGSAFKT
jgi:hypothetical protein